MSFSIPLLDFETKGSKQGALDRVPDTCPICSKSIVPIVHSGFSLRSDHAQLVFQCASSDCRSLFIGYYRAYPVSKILVLQYCRPQVAKPESYPECIQQISPAFIEIMGQAAKARSSSLDQLEGMGIRKALEFLVKDFASRKYTGEDSQIEKIRSMKLANCIEEHLKGSKAQEVAKRAVWLGNDETHYVRKWEGRDIADLRVLVKLTVSWIESELLTAEYLDSMNPS